MTGNETPCPQQFVGGCDCRRADPEAVRQVADSGQRIPGGSPPGVQAALHGGGDAGRRLASNPVLLQYVIYFVL